MASRSKRLTWELQPSNLDVAPPAEFLEAMRHYAGLEPAYRKRLLGTDGHLCELHILDDGLTWQLDFPELGRGVVYRIDATAGTGSQATEAKREYGPAKLRGLSPNSLYQLTAYAGLIQMSPSDSSVGDFTSGARFQWSTKSDRPLCHARTKTRITATFQSGE
jgi:hypothetical protein